MVQQPMDACHPGGGSQLSANSKWTATAADWASSYSMSQSLSCYTLIVQVVVASKFDNRLKEFAERWEVDRYLAATGYLHPNAKPFFVALPKVYLYLPLEA